MAEMVVAQMQQQLVELEQRTRLAEAALLGSQAQVTQMNTQLQQQSNAQIALAAGRGNQSMVDMRLLGKPDKWDGTDSRWKDWRFVTRAYLIAAIPAATEILNKSEDLTDKVAVVDWTEEENKSACKQIYYILVLLTSGRALDKVQGAGEGEGAEAWRSMHEQWEPRSRSRFTALLLALSRPSIETSELSTRSPSMRSRTSSKPAS